MLFLNPLLLWGLLAAAIPIAIHLLNRRRHKTIPWAAMQFLLKATRESRGKKKLRHFIILTCRALMIAALFFAAARPIVSDLIGWGSGSIETVVLVLDRSASMEIKPSDGQDSRREIVLQKVRDSLTSLEVSRLVLIDSASGKPQEIPSPDALSELAATGKTDTAADIPSLITRAVEYLAETPGRSEIWLASDLQTSSWQPDDSRWAAVRARLGSLAQRPAVRILSLTGKTAPNATIQLLSSRRSGNELLLELKLFRSADSHGSVTLPLTTHLNGTATTEIVTLAGQSLQFQKRVPLPPNLATGFGYLSIPADGNPCDNNAFFALGPARPIQSLIVAAAGDPADYLALAAAPPGLGNQSTQRIEPAVAPNYPTADLAAIFWVGDLPTGPAAEWLTRFLNSGGQVLFLPPALSLDRQFLDLKWSSISQAPAGKFFILKDWKHRDGPLRDGMDGRPIPAERFKAIRRQILLGDAAALARWEDGEPFLSRQVIEQGTAWFLSSTPDYTWSNLGDADVLLPTVQRVLTAGVQRFDTPYLTSIGSDLAQTQAGEIRTRLDDGGSRDAANSAYQSGVFRLGDRLLAINRPSLEDEPEVLTREQLDQVLEGTQYTRIDQAGEVTDPSLSREVWHAFLIAVLLLLISEAILCLPMKSSPQALPQKSIA